MNDMLRKVLFLAATAAVLPSCGNLDDTKILLAIAERVSLDASGAEVFGGGSQPAISADGRYAVFTSSSANLVAGDTNASTDVFWKDLAGGAVVRISVEATPTGGFPNGPDGTPDGDNANGSSSFGSLSADGNFVVFQSDAVDLLTDTLKPAGQTDIYLRDVLAGTTTLVSDPGAGFANGPSGLPVISPDGRFVAFESFATNLSADVVSGSFAHVFLWDRQTGNIELVTRHSGGAVANSACSNPTVSRVDSNGVGGVFVAFQTAAGNLVSGSGAATAATHIFRKAIPNGATAMVDAVNPGQTPSNGSSQQPAITPDGRFIVFRSSGTNLAAIDINGQDDIFLRDMDATPAGLLTLVSESPTGGQGAGACSLPSISPDGRYVVFVSTAPNLVTGDTNVAADIFWRDLGSVVPTSLRRVSVATSGSQASLGASTARCGVTADGKTVIYSSTSPDIVPGDLNGSSDIFTLGPLH